jgi:hypothetical protein
VLNPRIIIDTKKYKLYKLISQSLIGCNLKLSYLTLFLEEKATTSLVKIDLQTLARSSKESKET